jgi:ankyrin repeat protein
VEWLLANNADVNGMDDENYCALHHAAAKGRQQMVELLLARRADVNLKHAGYRYYNGSASLLEWGGFDDGNMPLHYAAFFGHKEVAELLLAAKAEVNAKEKSAGYAPLHWAAIKGHKNVTELLLANNAEVDARSSRGWTPLHYAALFGHKCMAELLLANHCDVNAINHDGETPWKLANSGQGWPNGRPISSERKDVAELLLRHGGRR